MLVVDLEDGFIFFSTTNSVTQNCIAVSDSGNAGDRFYDITTNNRKSGIAHYALRLNLAINCTSVPTNYVPLDSGVKNKTDSNGAIAPADRARLGSRNQTTTPLTYPSHFDEINFFPMYTTKRWLAGTTLHAELDHGVKQVSCIKLVGYAH